jgi:excisionase family DNA binding protein
MKEELPTAEGLAAYLQVSTKTVYRMLRRGRLPCYRVTKLFRFGNETIDEWLERDDKIAAEQGGGS